jgi:hypothetical protein
MLTAKPAPTAQPRQSSKPDTKGTAPKAKPQSTKTKDFTDFASI